MKLKKMVALLLALCVGGSAAVSVCSFPAFAAGADGLTPPSAQSVAVTSLPGYTEYISACKSDLRPEKTVDGTTDAAAVSYEGTQGVMMAENASPSYRFTVPETGCYALRLTYVACKGNNLEIEYRMRLDEGVPFAEAADLTLTKLYRDNGKPQVDLAGNEIRPEQVELPDVQTVFLKDAVGYVSGPFLFYLTAGAHTVTLDSLRGEALICGLQFTQPDAVPTAAEYLAENGKKETAPGVSVRVSAETPACKSSSMLYASCDKSSYTVDPYPHGKEKLNVMGGSNFGEIGQWVSYDVEIEKSGLYYLCVKYKQNTAIGTASYRDIYVDGMIPNDAFCSIPFAYSTGWKNRTVSDADGKNVPVYLTAGKHTLRIEVTLGEYGEVLSRIESSVAALNNAYLKSIMYLTSSPDANRDYDVKRNLPEVLDTFREQVTALRELSELIGKVAGGTNDSIALIDRMVVQLGNIVKKPETYPKRLSSVKSNITALAALITSLSAQPLMIDFLTLYTEDAAPAKAEAGFFRNVYNEIVNFSSSFVNDYSAAMKENGFDRKATVWIPTGRDQYRVLSNLIDNNFIEQKKIDARLKLVTAAALLPATVAGMGPDVIIQIANGEPINYAVRGAALDLAQFDDCGEVMSRFSEAATVPLRLGKSVYGMPETEAFYMMFYRTDILADLGLAVPETWEDFLVVTTELQKNNLSVGLPNTQESFAMFLLQSGGLFYQKDTYKCAINDIVGVKAFTKYTDMFTNYSLPLAFDPLTRFRMGEMPIVIAEYTFFNNLQVGAPEISNVWDFTGVPGTRGEDGGIDRSVSVTGTACMALEQSKDPAAAWEFIKWWTDTQTQIDFCRSIEMVLGTAGRVATANLEAAQALSWSRSNSESISKARKEVRGIENVPGSYFLSRHLQNAFRKVVISGGDAKESLRYYTKIINNEIESKCNELGVPWNANNKGRRPA